MFIISTGQYHLLRDRELQSVILQDSVNDRN